GLYTACVAFPPDGKTIAIGDTAGTLRLCETATGKELQQFQGAKATINAIAFSPDGQSIVSGGSGQDKEVTMRPWDIDTGKDRVVLQQPEGFIGNVAFSPDGKTVAAVGGKGMYLWDVTTGKIVRQWKAEAEGTFTYFSPCFAFSPDGRSIAGAEQTALSKAP